MIMDTRKLIHLTLGGPNALFSSIMKLAKLVDTHNPLFVDIICVIGVATIGVWPYNKQGTILLFLLVWPRASVYSIIPN